MMTLGEFRKVTENMENDLKIVFCTGCVYRGDEIICEEQEHYIKEVDLNYSGGESGYLFLNGGD